MPTIITDSDLLAIQAHLAPLQDKLNAPAPSMFPFCYPALEISKTWTEEADSQTGGTCVITPGTSTQPMKVAFAPNKGSPWANAYILHRNPYQLATMFAYLTSVTFPTATDIANCNAYEQDFQLNPGGAIFNWGWQFLFGTGLRIWNRSAGAWVKDAILQFPPFKPGIPKRLVMLFSRTPNSLTYRGVAIDEDFTPLNITFPCVAGVQNPYLNNAIQVDSKGQGAPINILLNECSVGGF